MGGYRRRGTRPIPELGSSESRQARLPATELSWLLQLIGISTPNSISAWSRAALQLVTAITRARWSLTSFWLDLYRSDSLYNFASSHLWLYMNWNFLSSVQQFTKKFGVNPLKSRHPCILTAFLLLPVRCPRAHSAISSSIPVPWNTDLLHYYNRAAAKMIWTVALNLKSMRPGCLNSILYR